MYKHKVQYYETDKMGIISPVVSVDCKYKVTSTFADVISIAVTVEEFKGVKLKLRYRMTKMSEEKELICCEAHSEHCFLTRREDQSVCRKNIRIFIRPW